MCSVSGCSKVVHARGMCQAHYRLWKKYGVPERLPDEERKAPGPQRDPSKPYSKFRPSVPRTKKSECKNGHPFTPENTYVYRGSQHCRTCRRERARVKNSDRPFAGQGFGAAQRAKTHCPRGHEYPGAGQPGKRRVCRPCQFERKYGISFSRYLEILDDQDWACAICFRPFPSEFDRSVHTDHDHNCCPSGSSCGKCVRGILCEHCNKGLGNFSDDPETLKRAVAYLEGS